MKSRSYCSSAMPWPRHSARAIASAVSRSESTRVPSRSNRKPRIAIASAMYHADAAAKWHHVGVSARTDMDDRDHRELRRRVQRGLLLGCLMGTACASRAQHAVVLYEAGDYAGAARAADAELAAHPG